MGRWIEQNWTPADGSGLSRRARQGGVYQACVPADIHTLQVAVPASLSHRAARVEQELIRLSRTDTGQGMEGIACLLLQD